MRITEQDLASLVRRLNKLTENPPEPWTTKDGKNVASIGNYHLDHAYGGVTLHRMHNESGGVENVFNNGHGTKRELYDLMRAFLMGVELGIEMEGRK